MADMVESPEAAALLADHLLDPGRGCPVICVTVPTWASQPLLDVATLERELDGVAVEVRVAPTGDATWELSRRLPTRLDVYGGAVRLWWPGLNQDSDHRDHPLFFVHSASDTSAVVERLLEALEQGGALDRRGPPLAVGAEYGAVVTRVLPDGAELTLSNDVRAYARRSHLSRHDLAPDRVVRVGQAVRVRVGHTVPGRRRVMVSLLPFEPDPWRRMVDGYPEGTVVQAVVTELRNFGAFTEVLPGLPGLIHKSRLGHDGVSHPDEILTPGQRLAVRIDRYEEVERDGSTERRIKLSVPDQEPGAEAVAASIFPDGPPWLASAGGPVADPVPEVRNLDGRGRPGWSALGVPGPRRGGGVAEPPEATPRSTAPDRPDVTAPAASGAAPPESPVLAATAAGESSSLDQPYRAQAELDGLVAALGRARELPTEVGGLLADGERRLARLRGEAAQIRRELEHELGAVRRRILALVESESAQLIGSTQEALDAARAEAAELREQLAAAEQDRHRLLERFREESRRAERAERAAQDARQDLARERRTADALRARVRRFDPDGSAGFIDDIHEAWMRITTPADRERYRWRSPTLGPDFMASLKRVHGVSRERVAEVCAEVVCGRAPERPGLELHPLRTGDGGEAPQWVRDDGAKAYRVALQVHSPSARRLHYWLLPDDRVELAKIVYHDDMSIR